MNTATSTEVWVFARSSFCVASNRSAFARPIAFVASLPHRLAW